MTVFLYIKFEALVTLATPDFTDKNLKYFLEDEQAMDLKSLGFEFGINVFGSNGRSDSLTDEYGKIEII